MWWIAIPVVIGAAVWILDELSEEAGDARNRWEDKRDEVEKNISWHDQEIQKHLKRAQSSYSYHLLVQKHFESVKVSDQAYKLLSDVKISLNAIGKAVVKAKDQRDRLIGERKRTNDRLHREELSREIDSLVLLRRHLFSEKDQILSQKEEVYCKVKLLNQQTEKLKYAIRDTTGYKGKEWHNRLEIRKNRKNAFG